jgi:hypothetical protein
VRRYTKQIRLAILALSAMIAAAMGVWFLSSDAPPPAPPAPKIVTTQPVAPEPDAPATPAPANPQAESALEDRLRQAAEYQPYFARLRALYPNDWTEALRAAAAQGVQNRDDAADLFLAESMRLLRQTRGRAGAKAGGPSLDRLFDLHLKVLRELAGADASLCVDFLNGAPTERFTAFSAGHRAVMADEALAGLDAIEDGAVKKIDREPPGAADFDDLEKALRARGLSKDAIDLLLDAKQPNPPISDDQACKNGVIYLDTLKNLPDLQRLRLYALAIEVMSHE